jgi:hypothetical protein
MKRVVAVSLGICLALVSQLASAQGDSPTWLGNRGYREGPGFLVGDFELHLGFGADFGYDSNYYRRDDSENVIGALRLRLSPSFGVSTLGPQRREGGDNPDVGFRFEVGATYNEFFPVNGGKDQADRDSLREQRDIGAEAKVFLDILPGREWSGKLMAGIGRVIRPTQQGDFFGGLQGGENFNRILPTAGAELQWAPGAGLLDWSLGYGFYGTFFESSSFGELNNFRNDILTRGRWRFLPRTALMYDASFGFITYPNAQDASPNKADSHPLRARIGLNGLVTPSFGVLALIGWGASFYADDQDFDSVLAQAEVKWYLTPTAETDPAKVSSLQSAISVGFIRDFEDSFIGTYVERDQGYARFNYLFGGVFLLVAEVRAGAVVYPPQTDPSYGDQAAAGWTDVRVDGTLFGEWRVLEWLGLNLDIGYTGYFSDTELEVAEDDPSTPEVEEGTDALGFQDIRAFLGARVFW